MTTNNRRKEEQSKAQAEESGECLVPLLNSAVVDKAERETSNLPSDQSNVYISKIESIEVFYRDKPLAFTTYNSQEKQGDVVDAKTLNEVMNNLHIRQGESKRRYKPMYNHPWSGRRKRKPLLVSGM